MKKFLLLFFACFSTHFLSAQSVSVGGQCITGSITLSPIDDIDGKPAYEGTGTVAGFAGTAVHIYWMPAPDNKWVLAFDGQPYMSNSCATNIPPGTANPYCSWIAVDGTECTGGTPLVINGNVILPVALNNFTANKSGRQVLLNWRTASENNNKGFDIQKSNDGVNWKDIGFVKGNAFSSVETKYQFADPTPFTGKNAYRLVQIDMDGKKSYSSIVSLHFTSNSFYTITNNPGRGTYNINMPLSTEKLEMKVVDIHGKTLYRKTTSAGNQLLNITHLPAGTYWLQMIKGDNLVTSKIVKL